ncbi:hypothetical protein KC343_g103 [Hortaea werneckii]|nr:hypothetical protein KC352_g2646 [Hortaea werneckii]KAI7573189.1 hypothetical protein KC317_g89 [Hortaea werneckii]KAI7628602.1 hypothetical protein KC346_g94 [Hortaea werneckii]KAI7638396.1 hypothetical protein KC343_g103 [Hortaea werneckii]KAI7724063.1 hypothetical protein KC322_g340 [Hortaea werneckii]
MSRAPGDAQNLFQKYGPEFWSDDTQHRLRWLADASKTNLNGSYPRDLYYSKQADRAVLWESFYLLMVAKCIRYYENHRSDWHYKTEPLDDQAEKTVDRAVLNGAVDRVLGSGRVASGHEEGDSSLNQRSPNAQKRHSNSTPVNTINYYTEDGEPPEQPPADVLLPSSAPHRLRKRSSVPGTGKESPTNEGRRTEASVNSMPNAEQAGSHSCSSLPSDSRMPPPTPVRTERYDAQGSSPASGIDTIASQVLGPYMESPVVSLLIGPEKPNFDRRDWEKIRSVLENVPATRDDAQALVTELLKNTAKPSVEPQLNRHKLEPQNSHRLNPAGHSTLPSLTPVVQPSTGNRPNITLLGSSSGLRNRTPWPAAGPATQPPLIDNAPRAPAQHRYSLDRRYLDMNPPTDDYSDALKRAELEIGWWADNEPSGWLQLEVGDDVESLFRKIDEEMPPRLNDRAIRAVRVEYLNPPPNSRASFNGRIRSRAEPGFKALVRRLKLLRDQSTPELTVTVEWGG